MSVVRLRMARITSEVWIWQKYPTLIDTDNGTIRLESRGQTDEEWGPGLDIEQKTQSEWRLIHPEFGEMSITIERGCACSGIAIKTDLRGRHVP